ncbi:MAG TPA: thermosome subunit beta [Candidatus Thermoplasmatota archaeon]|nr:thermosome subunit beta [Candidatus Thermoplasmatota archaeon]
MMGNQPIILLKEGTKRERGRGAQANNIMAARAVADAVRSTLGPRGMDKMLVDSMGDVVITNDGVTILKEIDIEHPAAKMIVEVAKTQDQECGDGTTSAVVIAGELLKRAEELLDDVHPTLINRGFRLANEKAIEILNGLATSIDGSNDKPLMTIAQTAMTGKSAGFNRELLATISVKAVKAVAETEGKKRDVDTDNIQVTKKIGGSVDDTQLIQGLIIDKERVNPAMAASVKNAKIALLDLSLEIEKPEVDTKIKIRDPTQLQAFLDEEERELREMVDKVAKTGANVLFCQKGIDDLAQHFLAKKGIYAVRRVKKSDMEKLEKATGARLVSNLDDLAKDDLGTCGLVEERKIGDESMTFVTECKNPRAVSILLRGGTEHVLDEIERALEDALRVVAVAVKDGKIVAGGGAPEIEVALGLRKFASTIGGREQLAIEAFANAVEVIPRSLAENAGLDAINSLVDLRSAHESGKKSHGLNVYTGKVVDMAKEGVLEPLRVKTQAINSATEAATMILRIDDVIAAKETKAPPGGGGHGHGGGMPPGMGGMGGMPGMM